MKITILQTDVAWQDYERNLSQAEALISKAGQADVYVLPEMFATGFVMTPDEATAEACAPITQWMARMASEHDAAICGSVATRDADGWRNRLVFAMPNGETVHYDKKHLFSYGGEPKHYAAGDKVTDVVFRDTRFRLAVCYDLRFPAWLRNSADEPYDALIVVASWPTPRQEAWNVLLRARAIENQAYVVGVNRTGADPVCTYTGGSAIIDAYGRTAAQCEDGKETFATAELDLGKLNRFREKFPVLKDKDDFLLR